MSHISGVCSVGVKSVYFLSCSPKRNLSCSGSVIYVNVNKTVPTELYNFTGNTGNMFLNPKISVLKCGKKFSLFLSPLNSQHSPMNDEPQAFIIFVKLNQSHRYIPRVRRFLIFCKCCLLSLVEN